MWSPFWTPRESVTIIRRYHSKDYRHVRKILEDGGLEPWATAWWRCLSGRSGATAFLSQWAMPVLLATTVMAMAEGEDGRKREDLTALAVLVSAAIALQQVALALFLRRFFLEDALSMTSDLDDLERGRVSEVGKDGDFFVAATPEGDVAVGCIAYKWSCQPELASVHRVYVRPEVRRFGVARKLLRRAVRDLREAGCRRVELWTSDAQESAVNFYLSVGFRLMERKAAATSPSSSSARLGFLHGVHDLKFEMKI